MTGEITDVQGIQVGQAQNVRGLTGCTVVLCRAGAVVGCDVRGLAPGTRETDLCRPGTLVERAQAVLLTGGSAFGLAAAEGVVRWLRDQSLGFSTPSTSVPIVPGAVLFDLSLGEPVWPDAAMGYEAAAAAKSGPVERGCAGAGTGATVGKIKGMEWATKSGIGTAGMQVDGVHVGALVAVNALGDVTDPGTGRILAGARSPDGGWVGTATTLLSGTGEIDPAAGNTTIGVVVNDASLTDTQAQYLARIAHDGLARTIHPVHTLYDGDAMFSMATGRGDPVPWQLLLPLGTAVVELVERAVVDAVRSAVSLGGLPAAADWG